MNGMFIIEVENCFLLNDHMVVPQSCGLLNLGLITLYENIVQYFFNTYLIGV